MRRATRRGVSVRSVICLFVFESMMLYARTTAVRSSGATANGREMSVDLAGVRAAPT